MLSSQELGSAFLSNLCELISFDVSVFIASLTELSLSETVEGVVRNVRSRLLEIPSKVHSFKTIASARVKT
jgi:hypothetical protein